MKKLCQIFIVIAFVMTTSLTLYAHSGGLNKSGGHHNRKTGGYHYHKKYLRYSAPTRSTVLRISRYSAPTRSTVLRRSRYSAPTRSTVLRCSRCVKTREYRPTIFTIERKRKWLENERKRELLTKQQEKEKLKPK